MRFVYLLIVIVFSQVVEGSDKSKVVLIDKCHGVVFIKSVGDDHWVFAANNRALSKGDQIRTADDMNSFVEITLSRNKQIFLGPGSQLVLNSLSRYTLSFGEIFNGSKKTLKIKCKKRKIKTPSNNMMGLHNGKVVLLQKQPQWLKQNKLSRKDIGSLVVNVNGKKMELSIDKYEVEIDVKDQIARTTITETFNNQTGSNLEGIFYFPLREGASISSLAMWINGERVEGDVVEKKKGSAIFDEIVGEQRDPALLEWVGGNLFKLRVFPILAYTKKKIQITYTEILLKSDGKVKYNCSIKSDQLSKKPLKYFSLKMNVSQAREILSFDCSEKNISKELMKHTASVSFSKVNYIPERDFEIELRTKETDSPIEIITYENKTHGYFMILFEPNWKSIPLPQKDISDKSENDEYVILIDTSGSISKKQQQNQFQLLDALLSQLKIGDRFNIGTVDTEAKFLYKEFKTISDANRRATLQFVKKRTCLGWSDLDLGFNKLSELCHEKTICIYMGDGMPTARYFTSDLMAKYLKTISFHPKNTFYAICTGSLYDKTVMNTIAQLGNKNGLFLRLTEMNSTTDIIKTIMKKNNTKKISRVQLDVTGVKNLKSYSNQINTTLFEGRQHIFIGRYKLDKNNMLKVKIKGQLGKKDLIYQMNLDKNAIRSSNSYLARLWAIEHLNTLLKYKNRKNIQKEIIALSKDYQIMTPLTSLLVLESNADRQIFEVKRQNRISDGKWYSKKEAKINQAKDELFTGLLAMRKKLLSEISNYEILYCAVSVNPVSGGIFFSDDNSHQLDDIKEGDEDSRRDRQQKLLNSAYGSLNNQISEKGFDWLGQPKNSNKYSVWSILGEPWEFEAIRTKFINEKFGIYPKHFSNNDINSAFGFYLESRGEDHLLKNVWEEIRKKYFKESPDVLKNYLNKNGLIYEARRMIKSKKHKIKLVETKKIYRTKKSWVEECQDSNFNINTWSFKGELGLVNKLNFGIYQKNRREQPFITPQNLLTGDLELLWRKFTAYYPKVRSSANGLLVLDLYEVREETHFNDEYINGRMVIDLRLSLIKSIEYFEDNKVITKISFKDLVKIKSMPYYKTIESYNLKSGETEKVQLVLSHVSAVECENKIKEMVEGYHKSLLFSVDKILPDHLLVYRDRLGDHHFEHVVQMIKYEVKSKKYSSAKQRLTRLISQYDTVKGFNWLCLELFNELLNKEEVVTRLRAVIGNTSKEDHYYLLNSFTGHFFDDEFTVKAKQELENLFSSLFSKTLKINNLNPLEVLTMINAANLLIDHYGRLIVGKQLDVLVERFPLYFEEFDDNNSLNSLEQQAKDLLADLNNKTLEKALVDRCHYLFRDISRSDYLLKTKVKISSVLLKRYKSIIEINKFGNQLNSHVYLDQLLALGLKNKLHETLIKWLNYIDKPKWMSQEEEKLIACLGFLNKNREAIDFNIFMDDFNLNSYDELLLEFGRKSIGRSKSILKLVQREFIDLENYFKGNRVLNFSNYDFILKSSALVESINNTSIQKTNRHDRLLNSSVKGDMFKKTLLELLKSKGSDTKSIKVLASIIKSSFGEDKFDYLNLYFHFQLNNFNSEKMENNLFQIFKLVPNRARIPKNQHLIEKLKIEILHIMVKYLPSLKLQSVIADPKLNWEVISDESFTLLADKIKKKTYKNLLYFISQLQKKDLGSFNNWVQLEKARLQVLSNKKNKTIFNSFLTLHKQMSKFTNDEMKFEFQKRYYQYLSFWLTQKNIETGLAILVRKHLLASDSINHLNVLEVYFLIEDSVLLFKKLKELNEIGQLTFRWKVVFALKTYMSNDLKDFVEIVKNIESNECTNHQEMQQFINLRILARLKPLSLEKVPLFEEDLSTNEILKKIYQGKHSAKRGFYKESLLQKKNRGYINTIMLKSKYAYVEEEELHEITFVLLQMFNETRSEEHLRVILFVLGHCEYFDGSTFSELCESIDNKSLRDSLLGGLDLLQSEKTKRKEIDFLLFKLFAYSIFNSDENNTAYVEKKNIHLDKLFSFLINKKTDLRNQDELLSRVYFNKILKGKDLLKLLKFFEPAVEAYLKHKKVTSLPRFFKYYQMLLYRVDKQKWVKNYERVMKLKVQDVHLYKDTLSQWFDWQFKREKIDSLAVEKFLLEVYSQSKETYSHDKISKKICLFYNLCLKLHLPVSKGNNDIAVVKSFFGFYLKALVDCNYEQSLVKSISAFYPASANKKILKEFNDAYLEFSMNQWFELPLLGQRMSLMSLVGGLRNCSKKELFEFNLKYLNQFTGPQSALLNNEWHKINNQLLKSYDVIKDSPELEQKFWLLVKRYLKNSFKLYLSNELHNRPYIGKNYKTKYFQYWKTRKVDLENIALTVIKNPEYSMKAHHNAYDYLVNYLDLSAYQAPFDNLKKQIEVDINNVRSKYYLIKEKGNKANGIEGDLKSLENHLAIEPWNLEINQLYLKCLFDEKKRRKLSQALKIYEKHFLSEVLGREELLTQFDFLMKLQAYDYVIQVGRRFLYSPRTKIMVPFMNNYTSVFSSYNFYDDEERDEHMAEIYIGLNKAYAKKNQLDLSVRSILNYIYYEKVAADRERFMYYIGTVFDDANDCEKLIQVYEDTIKSGAKENHYVRLALGQYYFKNENFEKAVKNFQMARTYFPEDLTLRNHLHFSLIKAGNVKEAYTLLLEGLSQFRFNLNVRLEIIEKLKNSDFLDESMRIRIMTSLVETMPDDSRSHETLAEDFEDTKDIKNAVGQWKQVMRLSPKDPKGALKLLEHSLKLNNKVETKILLWKLKNTNWDSRFGNIEQEVKYLMRKRN